MNIYQFNLSNGHSGCIYYERTGKVFSGIMIIEEYYYSEVIWEEEFIGHFKNLDDMIEQKSRFIKENYENLQIKQSTL